MKKSALIFSLLLLCSCFALAESNRRDGNWWVSQTKATKIDYMLGFLDGTDLGHYFSYWGTVLNGRESTCSAEVTKSFAEMNNKYFKDVTVGQLVDGLDTFYSDYRNRRLRTHHAVWLVLNSIVGKSQAEMDKMTESFRKYADD